MERSENQRILQKSDMNTENWIPVCERLPAVSEPVLTYDEASRTRSIAFLNNGRWLREYPDPMLRIEVRVTHWQPLPQMPPIRDCFDEWWTPLAGCSPAIMMTADDRHSLIHRGVAKQIWEAAVATTKST